MPDWRARRVGAVVFAVALLVRVVYLADSAGYPAFAIPIIDAHNYDACARQWLRGEGMSRQFFWQSFYYPLFLAGGYALSGGSVLAIKCLQVLVGAATCALTYRLGQRLFGHCVGLGAGLITALYGPLIFYDGEILPMGWAVFWGIVLVSMAVEAPARTRSVWWLACGVVGALAVLTRAEFLPFFLAVWVWCAAQRWRHGPGWRIGVRDGALVGVGFACVALPVAVQNARVTGHFGFLPAAGGINLYIGNYPAADKPATAVGFEWDRLQRMPEAEGVRDDYGRDKYFYRQTWDYIRHDPTGWLVRLVNKTLQFATGREIPRSVDVYAVRPWSHVQALLTWKAGRFGFPFGVLLPLALVGLVFSWRHLPGPVALFLVFSPLAVILVFVTGPYRLPVVPLLATLAAAGIAALARAVRARRWQTLALSAAGMAAIALTSAIPGPFPLERVDFEASLYLGLGHHYGRSGDPDRALDYYRQELSVRPDSVPAHTEASHILLERGRLDEALAHSEAVVRLRPDLAATRLNYGLALRKAGRLDQAGDELLAAVAREPTWARTHADLGALRLKQERYGEAAGAYGEAVRLAPWSVQNHFNLGIALAEQHELPAAIGEFREAARLAPDDSRVHFLLGVSLEEARRGDEAAHEYRTVLQADPNHPEALRRLRHIQQTTAPR